MSFLSGFERLEARHLLAAMQELAADINQSQNSSDVRSFTQAAGTTFFISTQTSTSDGSDLALWKTNGTEAGMTLLRLIETTSVFSEPELISLGDQLIFATNGNGGTEIWSSDGTVVGTQRLKQIGSEPNSSPVQFTNVNGTLFFTASGMDDLELWKSDGTVEGTVLVKDIRSGNVGSFPRELPIRAH